MADEDDDDKQFEPSQKKLDDARKKGEVPRSNDLSGAIAYGSFLLVLLVMGPWFVGRFGAIGVTLLNLPGAKLQFGSGASRFSWEGSMVASLGWNILPVFVVPGLMVLLSLLAQRSLVFAPSKIEPKLSRISPISNAKNKYGRSGLFEFLKSFVKLVTISLVLGLFLRSRMEQIIASMTTTPGAVASILGRLAIDFLAILVLVFGIIGAIDLLWQHNEHNRRNRMSFKDMKDESKESEGDPYMKQARRQRGQEIALSTMLGDVAEASVIVVNPEHYAIALKWDVSFSGPPVCVAKGVDSVAARIREAANAAGVPIHRDPPTARAIYAVTEIGEEIRSEHYGAVAAAIRFAEKMRAISRGGVLDQDTP